MNGRTILKWELMPTPKEPDRFVGTPYENYKGVTQENGEEMNDGAEGEDKRRPL